MRRVAIETFGCKVNTSDSEMLRAELSEFQCVSPEEVADIYIVNSCTVTRKADLETKHKIRQFQRRNPNALIVVTGCFAQTGYQELAKTEGVHLVVGNTFKHKIPELLKTERFLASAKLGMTQVQNAFKDAEFHHSLVQKPAERTRFFLKIQDGCDDFCTFCVIPYARGKNRSLPPDRVIEQIRTLVEADVKEVVLTGVSLGSYGTDLSPKTNLAELVSRIERETKLLRLRISSLEPEDVTDQLLSVLSDSEIFCPHFHLPLQSGDDSILEKMRRNYSVSYYEKLIQNISDGFKDVFIGIDVICGFPGETEKHFENSYRFLESLPWSKLHVFPYSKREGTAASRFQNHLSKAVIAKRAAHFRELSQHRYTEFLDQQIGKEVLGLIEIKDTDGIFKVISRNYLTIEIAGEIVEAGSLHPNTEVPLKISERVGDHLLAEFLIT